MALQGTLKDFGIADILQLIGQQQKNGTLVLKNRDEQVLIRFKEGAIVRAESTTRKKKDLIGTMLVRAEILTETQLQAALDAQQRTLQRLGDVLVGMKLIEAAKFKQMVQLQNSETLFRLFSWKSGTYEFEQGDVEVDPEGPAPMRAESVLMEGFRMVDEWPVIRKAITSYGMTFEKLAPLPAAAPPKPAQDEFDSALDGMGEGGGQSEFRAIGPGERRVYELVSGDRDVSKLIDLSMLGEFETCKALLNLVQLGHLRPRQAHKGAAALGPVATGESRVGRVFATLGRVALTGIVLACLGAMASRVDTDAFSFSSSPASTYADPAAQRFIGRAQVARIAAALEVYRLEKGEVPPALDALVDAGLLGRDDLRYPWRDPYYYRRLSRADFVLLPPLR